MITLHDIKISIFAASMNSNSLSCLIVGGDLIAGMGWCKLSKSFKFGVVFLSLHSYKVELNEVTQVEKFF